MSAKKMFLLWEDEKLRQFWKGPFVFKACAVIISCDLDFPYRISRGFYIPFEWFFQNWIFWKNYIFSRFSALQWSIAMIDEGSTEKNENQGCNGQKRSNNLLKNKGFCYFKDWDPWYPQLFSNQLFFQVVPENEKGKWVMAKKKLPKIDHFWQFSQFLGKKNHHFSMIKKKNVIALFDKLNGPVIDWFDQNYVYHCQKTWFFKDYATEIHHIHWF